MALFLLAALVSKMGLLVTASCFTPILETKGRSMVKQQLNQTPCTS
jgi:hypothetical protein